MTALIGILAFFLILTFLILVHELGHFSAAKLCGVRVDEFGLGFPPRLKGWKRGETIYSINALPLGGFVKMLGENGAQTDPRSFGSRPPWQRLVILFAGPGMNVLLAILIFFAAYLWGSPRGLTTVTAVAPGSPAAAAHLRVGDRILAEDGVNTPYLDDLIVQTDRHLGSPVHLLVARGRHTLTTTLIPRRRPPPGQGAMGIVLNRTAIVRHGPVSAFTMSLQQVGTMVAGVPALLGGITQHGGGTVEGPIGIAHVTTNVVHNEPSLGPGALLEFIALLSASLGVLNLLPIPALDGGRIVFVLLSWVRRRNVDPEIEGLIHMVGMAALLTLILVVSYQDIARWVSGGSF